MVINKENGKTSKGNKANKSAKTSISIKSFNCEEINIDIQAKNKAGLNIINLQSCDDRDLSDFASIKESNFRLEQQSKSLNDKNAVESTSASDDSFVKSNYNYFYH